MMLITYFLYCKSLPFKKPTLKRGHPHERQLKANLATKVAPGGLTATKSAYAD
jgi:hypothetical protein